MKTIKNIAKNFIETIEFIKTCRRIEADRKIRRKEARKNEVEYDILYLMSITD